MIKLIASEIKKENIYSQEIIFKPVSSTCTQKDSHYVP